jgi:hypothetical protein
MIRENQKLPENKSALFTMRFGEGKTLQEIANFYGVSRERVRQIIGNTGKDFTRKFVTEWVTPNENNTRESVLSLFPRGKGVLVEKLTKIHHKIGGASSGLKNGNTSEKLTSNKLTELGIKNKLMPLRHPFDILLYNKKTIDVKSAYTPCITSKKQTSTMYKFTVKKNKKGDYCDFFIFHIAPTNDYFVIPNEIIGYVQYVYMTWPESGRGWNKQHLQQYKNRFDLLV